MSAPAGAAPDSYTVSEYLPALPTTEDAIADLWERLHWQLRAEVAAAGLRLADGQPLTIGVRRDSNPTSDAGVLWMRGAVTARPAPDGGEPAR